ncbi:MAG TPA: preprotein translocase subunit SecE, partial [Bdellovibrio sp.]|nr:preprotein translocase subunit SecE [Bdellovibrio sp.]
MEERSNQSLVNFAFVMLSFLAYYVTNSIFEVLAGTFGAVARLHDNVTVKHGVPVAIGLIAFFVLFLNPKSQTWADESIAELRKVVWPSRKDTIAMTTVVCVMVVVCGIALGLFDLAASQLIKV